MDWETQSCSEVTPDSFTRSSIPQDDFQVYRPESEVYAEIDA